jgi:hypothetical protein
VDPHCFQSGSVSSVLGQCGSEYGSKSGSGETGSWWKKFKFHTRSVGDQWHFGTDPDLCIPLAGSDSFLQWL